MSCFKLVSRYFKCYHIYDIHIFAVSNKSPNNQNARNQITAKTIEDRFFCGELTVLLAYNSPD